MNETAFLARLDELAADIGRLRRQLEPEGYPGFLAARIAGHVETLDAIVRPTAADLYSVFLAVCGDEQVAVDEALEVVYRRADTLRSLLSPSSRAAA